MSDVDTETTEPVTETVDEPVKPVESPEPSEPEREPDDVDGPPDDDAPDVQPDEAPAAEAPQGKSQKEIDAQVTKLERASNTYTRKVAEILGDDLVDFVPSPLSLPFLFGFVFNPANVPLDEGVLDATRRLIGEPVPRPLEQDPEARTCPRCDGWGETLTGSKVNTKNTVRCRECQGRGWVGELANITPAQVAELHSVNVESNGHDGEPAALEDSWGTPIGHPDYGKMPQYRDQGWAEALEAYKRGEPAPVG